MALDPTRFLRALFDAAVASADPRRVLAAYLPEPPKGRTVVVGAGKAAGAMARAVEDAWPDQALEGVVVTRYGHAVPCKRIEVVEAGHPMPDEAGREAARRIRELARGLGPDDLLLCLISGGGSALLAAPAEGLSLDDKQMVTRALLFSGATITEINTVRKHLSAIKGGRLAQLAAPARILTLAISDVPGDDPAVIASGPTVPDPSTLADARAVLAKYEITPPRNGDGASPTRGSRDAEAGRSRFRQCRIPDDLDAAAGARSGRRGCGQGRRRADHSLRQDRRRGRARSARFLAAVALQSAVARAARRPALRHSLRR